MASRDVIVRPLAHVRRARGRGLSTVAVPRRELLMLTALTVLGAALRMSTLGVQSFWYDEVVTADIAGVLNPAVLFTRLETETSPPLYFVVLGAWSEIVGAGDVSLRLVAAICGTLTVPAIWAAGRRLVSARVGLIAAAIAATHPFLFHYGQENRPYAALALLAATGVWLTLLVRDRASTARLAAWSAVSAAAIATHYFAVFLVVPEALWLLAVVGSRRRVMAACTPVAAVGLALIPLIAQQSEGTGWIDDYPRGERITGVAHALVKGFDDAPGPLLGEAAVALVALGLLLVAIRAEREERRAAALTGALALAALAVPFLILAAGFDLIVPRNFIGVMAPVVLLVAIGLGARRSGWAGIGGAVLLSLVGIAISIATVVDERYHREDWRGIVEKLGPAREDRAVLPLPRFTHAEAPLLRYSEAPSVRFPAGKRVRELAIVGYSFDPARAPQRVGPFRLAERRDATKVAVLRYRSTVATAPSRAGIDESQLILQTSRPQ